MARGKSELGGSFTGSHMSYSHGELDIDKLRKGMRTPNGNEVMHATKWKNKRPICPYGCDQEGELVEVIMKDGKALGIYQDSEQLKFTAELQMAPKPTGRKVVIGPDGEPTIVEG